jgi:FKBP-type peptidyl-prolyl cis-trans isomerase
VNPVFPARSKEGFVRKSVAVIIAASFVAVTAGCSSIPQPSSCDPVSSAGDASNLISATGPVGEAPEVSFPKPVLTTGLQTTILTAGDGATLYEGDIADIQASLYVGETGELLTSTDYDPTNPVRLTVGDVDSAMAESIQCQTVGTRAATVLTVEEMYGADTLDPSLGLANDATLILVTDVGNRYLGRANGSLAAPAAGVPAVVTAPDGTPGITIPSSNPPTDLRIANVRNGDGDTVEEGDQVVVHYTGVLWGSDGAASTVFDSSWERNQPSTFEAVEMTGDDATAGLIPGLAEAIIGSTVGSQVIAVIPPEFGYPEGAAPSSIPAGSTLVFVLDILGIQ